MSNRTSIMVMAIVLLFFGWNVQQMTVRGEASIFGLISLLLVLFGTVIIALWQAKKASLIGKNTFLSILTIVIATVAAIMVVEIGLRIFSKDLQSYGERNGSYVYNTPYNIYLHKCDSCGGGYFFINTPNGHELFDKPEFHYDHHYNSLGLRDKEFKLQKDSNEYRILGLGDSFTEGVGTSADSTWLKQLEYLAQQMDTTKHFTTMNGGAHGSDLIYSFDLLTKCLLKYKPDMVILNLNSTDVNDIVFRGTANRSDANGNYTGKKGPWWEFLFGSSYLVRLVALKGLHYNWQLLTAKQQHDEEQKAYAAISDKIKDYQKLAEQNNFEFVLVLQPLQTELTDSTDILHNIKLDSTLRVIDDCRHLRCELKCGTDNINKYYWPIDGHFTTIGYRQLAKSIYIDEFLDQPKVSHFKPGWEYCECPR